MSYSHRINLYKLSIFTISKEITYNFYHSSIFVSYSSSFAVIKKNFIGTLTVEEIYKDRDQFAALVREVAAPDVGRMGIEILSFTIKDIFDSVQYLSSLGKAQTAIVKRDAHIGVAQAVRDAGIRVCNLYLVFGKLIFLNLIRYPCGLYFF